MNPYARMAEKYAAHPQEQSFQWYCDWHLHHGFLFSTPEFFIMGRTASRGLIKSIGVSLYPAPDEFSDTWYLHAFSGDMQKAWSIMPWELPWIAFERVREGKRELTFIEIGRLRRLCLNS